MEDITHILVVDRSRFARETLARALCTLIPNASVVTCGSARDAMEALMSSTEFGLMTTSLALDDLDGFELVRSLRHLPRRKDLPVVVISSQMEVRVSKVSGLPDVAEYFDKARGYPALIHFLRDFAERNFVSGRVLLVEDDLSAARRIQNLLEEHGFQVVHTSTAEEAESLLALRMGDSKDSSTYFDLVLSDFYLRGRKTAANLIHAIRVNLRLSGQQLPVLVITASDEPEKQVDVFRAGANDFVTKPFIDPVLITRVRSLILVKKQFTAALQQLQGLDRAAD